jgi:hypothetical protein
VPGLPQEVPAKQDYAWEVSGGAPESELFSNEL